MRYDNMAIENVKGITGKITEGLQKGQTAEGTITTISQGIAADYMNPEQVERRQVNPNEPFAEIEIAVEGTLPTFNFKDFSRIGTGGIPENSNMGKIMAVCDINVDAAVPMMAQETTGRPDSNGKVSKFVVWNIVGL